MIDGKKIIIDDNVPGSCRAPTKGGMRPVKQGLQVQVSKYKCI